MNNELIGVISNEGELKGVLEDNSFNVIVQITETGPRGPQGPKGEQGEQGPPGKSLEFHWNGTQLGVRVEGQTDYQYVDLKGEKGDAGDYVLPVASSTILGGIKVGENLKIDENGVLSVDTATNVEQDNTKPVTSAAVHVQLGNVEALLSAL